MNMGHEEEELLPYKEPTLDISDQKRIEILIGMGYPRVEVEESLRLHKFDDCYASYLLLGRKSTDVSFPFFFRILARKLADGNGFPHYSTFLHFTTIFACKSVVALKELIFVVSYCRNERE